MHNLPFDTTGLDAGEVSMLNDVYDAVKSKFNIDLTCEHNLNIHQFDLINCHNNPNMGDLSLGGVLQINSPAGEFHLAFIKIRYFTTNAAYSGEGLDYFKYQAWGVVNLKKTSAGY